MREIYLNALNHSEQSNEIDYVSSTKFYQKLHELEREDQSDIIVHMSTLGGSWDDGMALYDNIKYSPCDIICIGHGCIYSIGTVIFQACAKRYLMPNCSFMLHYGSLSLDCPYKVADDTFDYHRKQADAMVNIYYQRCKFGKFFETFSEKETKSFLRENLIRDWYMSGNDAVQYGFADEVLTERKYRDVRQINKRNRRVTK